MPAMASLPTKDAPLQSTRQLLNELDALMERMLALPIEEQDGEVPDEAEVQGGSELNEEASAAAAPTVAATLTLLEAGSQGGVAPLEETPGERARASEAKEASESPPRAPNEVAPSLPLRESVHYITAEIEAPLPTLTHAAAPPKEALLPLPPRIWARPSLGLQFLVWVNRGYDRSSLWFGRRGRWLRGRAVRMVLGLIGLGLLAAALSWLAHDWVNWSQ
jgi:hypothetical protein